MILIKIIYHRVSLKPGRTLVKFYSVLEVNFIGFSCGIFKPLNRYFMVLLFFNGSA